MSDTSSSDNKSTDPENRRHSELAGNFRRNQRNGRNGRSIRIILGSLAALFGLAVVAAVGAYAYVNHLRASIQGVHVAGLAAAGARAGVPRAAGVPFGGPSGRAMNVLIIARDTSGDPHRGTGTVTILHLNAGRQAGGVVAIHPFAYVQVPGHGRTELSNAAYYGGASLMVRTVSRLTGLHFQNYARIDLPHLSSVVNSIKGVDIRTPSGVEHFDGAAAVRYVEDTALDQAGRVLRQMALLRATATKIADKHLISHPPVLRALVKMLTIDSNFSYRDLLVLAGDLGSLSSKAATYVITPYRQIGSSIFLQVSSHSLWKAIAHDGIAGWARTHPRWVTPRVVP